MCEIISPLQEAARLFPQTELWNDSCGIGEVSFALERGAVGATSNPVIVGRILKEEISSWRDRITEILRDELPEGDDIALCWQLSKEAGLKSAHLLLPLFEQTGGKRGWQAIQVDPRYYRSAHKTIAHAVELSSLERNILIKMPVSSIAPEAIEECTYRGISVNGTVCFSVSQAVAVAKAVERGLCRREAQGLSIDGMNPSCTIMAGRINDWIAEVVEQNRIPVAPEHVELAGVAVLKKVYSLFKERGYRLRVLGALNNSHWLWTHFLGGDLILTINPVWWRRLEGCSVPVVQKMDEKVPEEVIGLLSSHVEEFRKIYDEEGMAVAEFDHFGAFHRTMREFYRGYEGFLEYLRSYMLPLPDEDRND